MVCHCYIIVLATWYCKFDLSLFSNAPQKQTRTGLHFEWEFLSSSQGAENSRTMIFRCCEDAVGDTSDAQKTWGSKGWKSWKPWIVEGKDPQEPQVLTKSRVFLQIFYTFFLETKFVSALILGSTYWHSKMDGSTPPSHHRRLHTFAPTS